MKGGVPGTDLKRKSKNGTLPFRVLEKPGQTKVTIKRPGAQILHGKLDKPTVAVPGPHTWPP